MDRDRDNYLIAGLGNPGPEYSSTRHNIGAKLLKKLHDRWNCDSWRKKFDAEYARCTIDGHDVHLLFPQTFMNLSGRSVAKAARDLFVDHTRIIVLHDDVDLEFGRVKIKTNGGTGGHNGLKSIVESMGSQEFIRVRLGVGRPPHDMISYVLGSFTPQEKEGVPEILEKGVNAVELILNKGVVYAMNASNGQEPLKSVKST